MAISIQFDDEFIESLRRKIDVFHVVAVNGVRAEALKLVADGFQQSKDPYGNEWEPLKYRDGNPLIDTGRLRASFTAQESFTGNSTTVTVGTNVQYAKYHQFGTVIPAHKRQVKIATGGARKGKIVSKKYKGFGEIREISVKGGKIPARPMLPTEGESSEWNKAIEEVIEDAWRRAFG